MAEELKPCPFCGGKVRLESSHGFNYVLCKKCKSEYYPASFGDGKKVVSAWNTRPIEDDLNEQIGRFKKYADALEKEVKTLRAALETILDASQQDDPCVLGISVVAYEALKKGKKDAE